MPYSIKFDRDAIEDLRRLLKGEPDDRLGKHPHAIYHANPTEQGTSIKALEQPAISQFRLRVGDFRVYYDVDDVAQEVHILRVVRKGTRTTEEVTKGEGH